MKKIHRKRPLAVDALLKIEYVYRNALKHLEKFYQSKCSMYVQHQQQQRKHRKITRKFRRSHFTICNHYTYLNRYSEYGESNMHIESALLYGQ